MDAAAAAAAAEFPESHATITAHDLLDSPNQ